MGKTGKAGLTQPQRNRSGLRDNRRKTWIEAKQRFEPLPDIVFVADDLHFASQWFKSRIHGRRKHDHE